MCHLRRLLLQLTVLATGLLYSAMHDSAFAADELPGLLKARQASLALSKGQLQAAVQLYSDALQDKRLTNDRKGVILSDRGVVHARMGQTKKSLEDFNQAIRLFPEYAAAYNNRGSVLLGIGIVEEALKDFDRAVVLAPGYVAAYNNRAGALVKLGKLGLALEDYAQAIKLAPTQSEPLGGRARVKLRQNRSYSAIRDLDRAISNDSRFTLGYRLRAKAHVDLGEFVEATKDYSRAIAFDPNNAAAYLARGRAYIKARKIESAVTDFSKVIEIKPQSSEAYRERGHAYVLLDNFEAAEQDLARSLELEPRAGITFAYRALMYKKQGQPELGAQEIEKAVQLAAKDPRVLWAKGEIEEALAATQLAAESFRTALALDPNQKNAEFGLARLGEAVPNQAVVLEELSFGPWRIVLERERYYATNPDYRALRVPLEMAGPGQPKILNWEAKGENYENIGLLRYTVGQVDTRAGKAELEYVALINTKESRIIDIIPNRRGKAESRWTWGPGRVTVASVDGLTVQHVLRRIPDPLAVARPRVRRPRFTDSNDAPWWAPWAQQAERPRVRSRRSSRRRRRRRPKTLFDTLFGN